MSAPTVETAPGKVALAAILREMYRGPAWHGPALRSVLRGVDHEEARLRAGPGRNSIWELVLHLACTRQRMLGRLAGVAGGESPGRFPRRLRKAWWPETPDEATEETWRADLTLLDDYQERLVRAVEEAPEEVLARHRPGKPWPIGGELLRMAPHDAYHTGQIRLIRLTAGRG